MAEPRTITDADGTLWTATDVTKSVSRRELGSLSDVDTVTVILRFVSDEGECLEHRAHTTPMFMMADAELLNLLGDARPCGGAEVLE